MSDYQCPSCTDGQAGVGQDKCELLNAAYVFAGLAMMLNIRLSYSSAPYALIRFKLPENLFSVFVRRMASALEVWCLPSMLLGNIVEYGLKGYYLHEKYTSDFTNGGNLKKPSTISITDSASKKNIEIKNLPHINDLKSARVIKFYWIIVPSIATQWLNFLTYVILLIVYLIGGDQGHLTTFYFVIAISGVVFGINMVLLYAVDWNYIPVYMVGENSFPALTSFIHYMSTLIFGNRRKWNSDFLIVFIDIGVAIVISLVAAIVWTAAYGYYTETKIKEAITGYNITSINTIKYGDCPTPGTQAADKGTGSINTPDDTGATLTITGVQPQDGVNLDNTDTPCSVKVEGTNKLTINYKQDGAQKCIEITSNDTKKAGTAGGETVAYGHIFTETFDSILPH